MFENHLSHLFSCGANHFLRLHSFRGPLIIHANDHGFLQPSCLVVPANYSWAHMLPSEPLNLHFSQTRVVALRFLNACLWYQFFILYMVQSLPQCLNSIGAQHNSHRNKSHLQNYQRNYNAIKNVRQRKMSVRDSHIRR